MRPFCNPISNSLFCVAIDYSQSDCFTEVRTQGFEFEGGREEFRRAAFHNNIGLLTEEEQYKKIPNFRIAVAGVGAVGGYHLTTLVHQGFENFNIADPDKYDVCNIQRQRGAFVDTKGKFKTEVIASEILRMNPYCNLRVFDRIGRRYGVFPLEDDEEKGLDSFLEGVDLLVDGLDFYSIYARRDVINKACEKEIPVISAGPIGFGTGYLIFMPKGQNFDEYFGVSDEMHEDRMLLNFLLGVAPRGLNRKYMNDMKIAFDAFVRRKPPSLAGAVQLCAGVTALNSLKILLGKGKVYPVPWYHQFDTWKGEFVRRKRRIGPKNIFVKKGIEKILKELYVNQLHRFHEENPGKLIRD